METTVTEHPNATLFRKGYEAFNNGDMDTIRSLFDQDITWHAPGRSRFSRDRRGIDDTLASFMEIISATGGTFHVDVHDIVANDEHAVAIVTQHWDHEGTSYEDRAAHVVHLKDGKLTESWYFDEKPYLFDEQFPA